MMAALANRQAIEAVNEAAAPATMQASRAPKADVARITPDDVRQLQANPSPEIRSRFAGKFGQQYDDFIAAGSQEFADAILMFLAKDVEATVRQALTESIAESPNLPATLAVDLASDKIAIARPILEKSPILEEDRLAEIVRDQAMYHALAVAGRHSIGESLADTLIDSRQSEVILRLIANEGAAISNQALVLIAKDFHENTEIQERLASRPNLPAELVDHLLSVIGNTLKWDLVTNRSIDAEEARRLIAATKERTLRKLSTDAKVEKATMRSMHERMAAGELKAVDILGFLRNADIRKFEISLATMAGLQVAKVRELLYDMDKRCLAVLGLRAGLGAPQYLAIRMALDLAERRISDAHAQHVKYPPDTARYVQEQYDRIRKDEKLIRQLLQ